VYSQEVQDEFNREKHRKALLRRWEANQCRECGHLVQGSASFWSQFALWGTTPADDSATDCLKYCHYCMDTQTCKDCMAEEKVFIPRELQINGKAEQRRVC